MTQTAEPAPQTGLLYIVILSYPFRLFNHYCRVFLDLRQLQPGKAVRHLGEQRRRYPVARLPVFHKKLQWQTEDPQPGKTRRTTHGQFPPRFHRIYPFGRKRSCHLPRPFEVGPAVRAFNDYCFHEST